MADLGRRRAAASTIASILWTAVSPTTAFIYLAGWMALAATGLAITNTRNDVIG